MVPLHSVPPFSRISISSFVEPSAMAFCAGRVFGEGLLFKTTPNRSAETSTELRCIVSVFEPYRRHCCVRTHCWCNVSHHASGSVQISLCWSSREQGIEKFSAGVPKVGHTAFKAGSALAKSPTGASTQRWIQVLSGQLQLLGESVFEESKVLFKQTSRDAYQSLKAGVRGLRLENQTKTDAKQLKVLKAPA